MHVLLVAAAGAALFFAGAARAQAQSGTRGEAAAEAPRLPSLNGPQQPAPPTDIQPPSVDGVPSVDETIKSSADVPDVDNFLSQSKSADLKPIPDLDQPATATDDSNEEPASEAAMPQELGDADAGSSDGAPSLASLDQRIRRLEMLIEAQSATLQEIRDKVQPPPIEELRAIRQELVTLRSTFQTVAKASVNGQAVGGSPGMGGSLQRVGRLVVENQTAFGYPMSINGFQFTIMPGRREFNVPVGRVVTQLLGYENARTWSEEDWRQVGDDYRLAIQIQ